MDTAITVLQMSKLLHRSPVVGISGAQLPPVASFQSASLQVVLCGSCNAMLCQPTGGIARLTEGCSFRKKVE